MLSSFFEPRFFNFVILSLYTCTAIWWALHGRWWDVGYWCAAFAITFVVTFGYRH